MKKGSTRINGIMIYQDQDISYIRRQRAKSSALKRFKNSHTTVVDGIIKLLTKSLRLNILYPIVLYF